jgi:hypothetical protein
MNGNLSRLQREVILLSLRSWIRPHHAALQDTESDTPVMTTLASELKCRDKCLRESAKVVEGTRQVSISQNEPPSSSSSLYEPLISRLHEPLSVSVHEVLSSNQI